MEESQKTIRKLVAFATVVVLFAGVPHFLLDRNAVVAAQFPDRSYEYLLPAEIGKFHVVNRWKSALQKPTFEQGAIYQDPTGKLTAQFAIMINFSRDHNGLVCYLAQGLPLRSQRIEQVQAADSSAIFDVGFIGDQSLSGAGHSTLFIASTECGTGGCREAPFLTRAAPQIVWSRPTKAQRDSTDQYRAIPLSITFQSIGGAGDVQDQERALLQFRDLVSKFKLVPLRELSAVN
jgi:hypothetical protein